MVARPGSFAVLVPVKSPGTGKSRLSALPDEERRRLAAAFATDTVTACLDTALVGLVVVISDDAAFASSLVRAGVVPVADPGGGLNAALLAGAAVARSEHPDLQPAALLADVPALTPEDLGAALGHALSSGGAWYAADADTTGTTLYTAPHHDFAPRFGAGSAAAHHASGARPLPGALPGLRRDVDDLDGLAAAVALGVGDATAAALGRS